VLGADPNDSFLADSESTAAQGDWPLPLRSRRPSAQGPLKTEL